MTNRRGSPAWSVAAYVLATAGVMDLQPLAAQENAVVQDKPATQDAMPKNIPVAKQIVPLVAPVRRKPPSGGAASTAVTAATLAAAPTAVVPTAASPRGTVPVGCPPGQTTTAARKTCFTPGVTSVASVSKKSLRRGGKSARIETTTRSSLGAKRRRR